MKCLSLFRDFIDGLRDNRVAVPTALVAGFSFWSTAAVEIVAVVLVVLFLVFHRPHKGYPVSILLLLWAVYFFAVLLSIVAASNPGAALYLRKHWYALLFIVAWAHSWTDVELALVGKTFMLSGAAVSLGAIARFISGPGLFAEPLFMGSTTYGNLLTMAGLTALYCVARSGGHSWGARMFFGTVLLLSGLGVFLASRFAQVMVFCIGGVVLLGLLRPKLVVAWTLLVVLFFLVSPDALWFKCSWILQGNPTDRYLLWHSGIGLLEDLPFLGYGPESYEEILPHQVRTGFSYRPPSSWHNDFLKTTLESGWIAGIAYTLFAISLMLQCARKLRRAEPRHCLVLCAVLLGAHVFFSSVGTVVSTAVLGVMGWLLCGIIAHQVELKGARADA